jgi:hypothetical protein
MNTTQRTRQLSERLALDLRYSESRPHLSIFRRLNSLPNAESAQMEILPAAHQAPEGPSSPGTDGGRASIFTWGSTLRSCPQLGHGTTVPCFLRSDRPVTVASINATDLKRFINDFWSERDSGSEYLNQVMPEALNTFIMSFGKTDGGAKELSYSLVFALLEMAPRSCDASLFYNTMMMDVDESSRFAIQEICSSLETLVTKAQKNAQKFLRAVLENFPWTLQIQSELESILKPYIDAKKELDVKDILSLKKDGSFAQFLLRFFIAHRRRLMQRIFHGLTLAASRAFPPEHELSARDLLCKMVFEAFSAIDARLSPQELHHLAQLALGERGQEGGMAVGGAGGDASETLPPEVVEYINLNRASAGDSQGKLGNAKSVGKKKPAASKSAKDVWPLSHKLFPLADSADVEEDDMRVMHLPLLFAPRVLICAHADKTR